jgi:hypothetical protein
MSESREILSIGKVSRVSKKPLASAHTKHDAARRITDGRKSLSSAYRVVGHSLM